MYSPFYLLEIPKKKKRKENQQRLTDSQPIARNPEELFHNYASSMSLIEHRETIYDMNILPTRNSKLLILKRFREDTLSVTHSGMQETYKLRKTEQSPQIEWTLYFEAARVVHLNSAFSLSFHRQRPDLNSNCNKQLE